MRLKNKGFTLVEVLMYIALSSLLLTGVIVSTYQLIDANSWFVKRVDALHEGHFVLQKITWLLQQRESDNSLDFEVYLEDDRIWITRNGNEPQALTSSRVVVEGLEFDADHFRFFINEVEFKKAI